MTRSLRVLIIEDSEEELSAILRQLRESGYAPTFERIETAEAMRTLLSTQIWDIVISGYRISQFGALDALELLKRTGLDIPFVIVSGPVGEEAAVAAQKAGAHDFIMKDNMERLGPAIEREIQEAEARKRRRLAENRSVRIKQFYSALGKINEAIVHIKEPKKLFEEACRIAVEEAMCRMAWIGLVDSKTRMIKPVGHWGVEEGYLQKIQVSSEKIPEGFGPTGTAIREGRPVVCDDIENDPLTAPWRDEASKRGYRSSASFPLRSKGRVIGTLSLLAGETYFFDSQEEIHLFEQMASDISFAVETMDQEKHRRSLEEQLRQSQRMEAIGRLAGGIAHDFNNLLTVIQGYGQLALINLKKDDPVRRHIEEIDKASERATGLTRQLLAFSRRQTMELKVLDLATVVRNLDKMLRRLIGEDIELLMEVHDNVGKVKVDPGQIEQVILNLAINAKDAMPEGGSLIIEIADTELDEEYSQTHVAVKPGHYVMLSVSDTGCGMTPEVKEMIFEPFFTTKEKGKGTGLGLSTAYGIVKQSGGNIWVYSEPGHGTTFKIYLPRVNEPAEESRPEVTRGDPPQGNETILLVEDEEEVRKLAALVLRRQGYQVLETSHPGEAAILCDQYREMIHLMVTDVVLPVMSGRKLAENLLSVHPEMKVLYMSGYTDNTISHHGILEEGLNYIQKPFTVDALVRKVRDVLDTVPKPSVLE